MTDDTALETLEDAANRDLAELKRALDEVGTTEIVALMGRSGSRRRALLFRLR